MTEKFSISTVLDFLAQAVKNRKNKKRKIRGGVLRRKIILIAAAQSRLSLPMEIWSDWKQFPEKRVWRHFFSPIV